MRGFEVGHEFSVPNEAVVQADVDDVWTAIATGPGVDSWFMGRTEVAEGVVRTSFGGYTPECPIAAEEPGRRFAYATPPAPDGRFIAYDFLIEAAAGGTTTLRMVTSGFVPGDDWAEEYEAMSKGGLMFFRTLVEYLNHFAGRIATPVAVSGPAIGDWSRAWERLGEELGLAGRPATGDRVRVAAPGAGAVSGAAAEEGMVYFTNDHTVGVRTDDALYRFMRGFRGPMLAMHELFAPVADVAAAEQAWRGWLDRVFG